MDGRDHRERSSGRGIQVLRRDRRLERPPATRTERNGQLSTAHANRKTLGSGAFSKQVKSIAERVLRLHKPGRNRSKWGKYQPVPRVTCQLYNYLTDRAASGIGFVPPERSKQFSIPVSIYKKLKRAAAASSKSAAPIVREALTVHSKKVE